MALALLGRAIYEVGNKINNPDLSEVSVCLGLHPRDLRIVHINCASIIFPFIRESVADLTRRSGLTPLILDPVNFVALYESSKEKEKKFNKKSENN